MEDMCQLMKQANVKGVTDRQTNNRQVIITCQVTQKLAEDGCGHNYLTQSKVNTCKLRLSRQTEVLTNIPVSKRSLTI